MKIIDGIMHPLARLFIVFAVFITLLTAAKYANAWLTMPDGSHMNAQDASPVYKAQDGKYWIFHTGAGVRMKSSSDGLTWNARGGVFASAPTWWANYNGGNGVAWAPTVIESPGGYLFVYYSVSTLGSQTSAIGLAVSYTLDPADGFYDAGIIINSSPSENNSLNAIDPSVVEAWDGSMWMSFGSYWDGIKVMQIDRWYGTRICCQWWDVARRSGSTAIEGSALVKDTWNDHGYFLFVSYGTNYPGADQYRVKYGRSEYPWGPFYDKDGNDMAYGGGSTLLPDDFTPPNTNQRYVNGHAEVLSKDNFGTGGSKYNWITHGYYDPSLNGGSGGTTVGIQRLVTETINGIKWPKRGGTVRETYP